MNEINKCVLNALAYWTSPQTLEVIKIDPFVTDKIVQLALDIQNQIDDVYKEKAIQFCKERIFTIGDVSLLLKAVHTFDQAFPSESSPKRTFVFENGEERAFSALELKFLTKISQFFELILNGKFIEGTQPTLSLKNIQKSVFDALFLTLENGMIKDVDQAFAILKLSAFLQITHSPAEKFVQKMWSFEKDHPRILTFTNQPEIRSLNDSVREHLAEFLLYAINEAVGRKKDPQEYLEGLKNLDPSTICFTLNTLDEVFEIVLDKLPNLTDLNQYRVQYTLSSGLMHLSKLTGLKTLRLNGVQKLNDQNVSAVSQLTTLTSLNLCHKEIGDARIKSFETLANLKTLDLNNNRAISDEGVLNVARLSNLEILNISNCGRISNIALQHLELLSLQKLFIGGCSITDEGLKHLIWQTKLVELNFQNCKEITGKGLTYISALTNLRVLNLRACNVNNDLDILSLSSLQNLSELNISYCENLSNLSLKFLSTNNTQLAKLELSGGKKYTDHGFSYFYKLPNLTELDLHRCSGFSSEGMKSLLSLTKLQYLELSETQVSHSGFKMINQLPLITFLGIKNCPINGYALSSVYKMPQLRTLIFGNKNKFDKEDQKELKNKFPHLELRNLGD